MKENPIISYDGLVWDSETKETRQATLMDLLAGIKDARQSIATWARYLQWDANEGKDLAECINGITYWYNEEKRFLAMIDSGSYEEFNNYGDL